MCHLCQNMWGNKQAAPPWSLEFKCSIDLGRKSKVLWKWCVCVHACSELRKWREMWRDRENSTTIKYSFSSEEWNKIKNRIQMSATPRWGNEHRAIEGWGQGKGTCSSSETSFWENKETECPEQCMNPGSRRVQYILHIWNRKINVYCPRKQYWMKKLVVLREEGKWERLC